MENDLSNLHMHHLTFWSFLVMVTGCPCLFVLTLSYPLVMLVIVHLTPRFLCEQLLWVAPHCLTYIPCVTDAFKLLPIFSLALDTPVKRLLVIFDTFFEDWDWIPHTFVWAFLWFYVLIHDIYSSAFHKYNKIPGLGYYLSQCSIAMIWWRDPVIMAALKKESI